MVRPIRPYCSESSYGCCCGKGRERPSGTAAINGAVSRASAEISKEITSTVSESLGDLNSSVGSSLFGTGSTFTAGFSESFNNLLHGNGFNTNADVLNNMAAPTEELPAPSDEELQAWAGSSADDAAVVADPPADLGDFYG